MPGADVTTTDWHYEIDGDKYAIVNTQPIPATSKSMFQFTITGIFPQYIVDESECDTLIAHVELVTHEGNTIWLDSNPLVAQIDTEKRIRSTYKSGEFFETAADGGVPASLLQNLPGGAAAADDYVYVKWYSYPSVEGNQPYSLDVSDTVDGAYEVKADGTIATERTADGIMLGATNGKGQVADGLTYTWRAVENVQSGSPYVYLWTAYPSENFKYDHTYSFPNKITWTLTEEDPDKDYWQGTDPQLVTTATARDTVRYTKAKWEYPPGVFLSYKYTESTPGHQHPTHTYDVLSTSNHKKNYTYEMALNHLRNGEDVTMNYEVLSVGYGYAFTAGPLANAVMWEDINGVMHEAPINSAYDDNWNSAEWAEDPEHYLNWYYVMDTTDRWEWFSAVDRDGGDPQLIKADSDDYYFNGITIAAPEMFNYGKQRNSTYHISEDSMFGFAPDSSIPKPAVEVWVEYNNDGDENPLGASGSRWEYLGSYQVNSGTKYVAFPDGVTGYRTRITTNQAACKLAVYPKITLRASERVQEIVQNLFEVSEVPSTTYRNDESMHVELFKYAEDPANTDPHQAMFLDDEVYFRQHINDDNSRATLTGGGYGVEPAKSIRFNRSTDNDVVNRRVNLHYTATVYEASNLSDRALYNEAIAEGAIRPETSGTWYDLLPEGVVPLLSTVQLRPGDTIKSLRTIENYKGSGRILLIIQADLKPSIQTRYSKLADVIQLKFDATYDWTDINNLGSNLVNYVAFESGSEGTLGTLKGRMGEPDAMERVYNDYTPSKQPAQIVEYMRDLDPNSDDQRFVYAYVDVNLNVDQMAQTEYVKSVKSDLVGVWTQGLNGQEQVNVYEGEKYTYRLRVASAKDTTTKDMVLYDSLENYLIPDPENATVHDATKAYDFYDTQSKKNWSGDWQQSDTVPGGQWRGKLYQVDVSEFVKKGCAPVIYYSTQPWMQFGDTSGQVIDESIFFDAVGHYMLEDAATWTKVTSLSAEGIWNVPDGLDVTAIAIDARASQDGGSFELTSQEAAAAYLHMTAPDDHNDENQWHAKGAYAHKVDDAKTVDDIDWVAALDPVNNMHAYNNTRLIATQVDTTYSSDGAASYRTMIRNDYTRVGIMPQIINVQKVWQDDDNHDNLRPSSITVTLKRKLQGAAGDYQVVLNETTGQPMTLKLSDDNEWSGTFYQTYVQNEDGIAWLYTVEESAIENYTGALREKDGVFILSNSHSNEKISLTGEKLWLMPDGTPIPEEAESDLPSSIVIHLMRKGSDGEPTRVTSKTVRPDEEGKWTFAFTNLDKYERGGFEYVYYYDEGPLPANSRFVPGDTEPDQLPDHYDITFDYEQESDEYFYNFYMPYGDLQVDKSILDATSVSKTQKFTFTLTLTDAAGRQLDTPYDYTIYDVTEGDEETLTQKSTGSIVSGDTFQLMGGQRFVLKKLPAGTRYELIEADLDGWKLTSKSGDSGTIQPVKTSQAAFVNRYSASGEVQLKAKKSLTGHQLRRGQFRFDLVDVTADSPTNGATLRTAGNNAPADTAQDADGVITNTAEVVFGALTYTQADAGKTFTYEIRERIPEDAENNVYKGYTYDDAVYTVTVTVTDNGDGTLKVVASPADAASSLFENTYAAEGEKAFKAHKTLVDRELQAGEFSFELWESNADAERLNLIETVTNDADGNVNFTALHYTEKDVTLDPQNPTTLYFLVREVRGTDHTVNYAKDLHLLKLEIYDNGDGTLTFAEEGQKVIQGGGLTLLPFVGNNASQIMEWLDKEHPSIEGSELSLCPDCGGSGYAPDGVSPCPTCLGGGLFYNDVPMGAMFTNYYYLTPDYASTTILCAHDTLDAEGYCTVCGLQNPTAPLIFAAGSAFPVIHLSDGSLIALGTGPAPLGLQYGLYDETQFAETISFWWYGTYWIPAEYVNEAIWGYANHGGFSYWSNVMGPAQKMVLAYMVLESGGDGVSVSGEETIPEMTNTLKPGDLEIKKYITSVSSAHASDEFTFKVKLSGYQVADSDISFQWVNASGNQTSVFPQEEGKDIPDLSSWNAVNAYDDDPYYILRFNGNGGRSIYPIESYSVALLRGEDATIPNYYYRLLHHVESYSFYLGSIAEENLLYTAAPNADGSFTLPGTVQQGLEDGTAIISRPNWVADTEDMDEVTLVFQLLGGQSYKLYNVPATVKYEVWEESPRGWVLVEKSNDAGEILADELVTSEFTNEYAPSKASASLTASKRLDGELCSQADRFQFELYEVIDGTEKLIDTKGNTSGGVASFDVITYNLQSNPELAGVHTYKIREVNTADPTIIYDEHTETVTVNVYQAADPNDASLFLTYADVTYQDEAGSASNGVFRNETKPGNLQITKTIENATAKASAQAFEITVTFTDGYSEPVRVKIGSKAETEMTPQAGKLVFSLKADESALITEIPDKTPYTISEKSLPGWTLTGAVKTTQVDGAAESAEEDVLGSLSGKIVTITTDRVTLTNTYAVSGKNPLQAEKLVEGETPEGQAYSFELYAAADWNESAGEPADGASPLEARGNASVDDDGRSLINFSAISYDADGEYVYFIRELAGDDPTMEYDSRVVKATVTAEDKAGDGTLTFTVSYSGGEGDDQNAFLNVRKPGTLKITKTALNTTDACEGQKFTIRIKLTDKNGKALASQRYNTLVDGANGPRLSTNASGTGSLTIQAGQTVTVLGLPHGATYTLTETAVSGYTLTASEGAQGVITGDQESSASFENTYDAAGDMTLQVKKVMDPASLAIPEGVFAFELRSQDGTLLETVTAGTDGSASFSKISYDLSDVGQTYVYTVREVDHDYSLGADSTEEPVYVFDSTVYTVTVTVKDENGKGVLTAEPEYTADGEEAQGITFTNSSLVKVRVTKNWEGDALRQTQRPARITLNLFADGEMINSVTITAAQAIEGNSNQWAYTFNDLPEYKDGEKIVYTVTESPLAMYAAVVTAEDDYHYTITNTYAETSLSFGAVKTFKDHWTGEELPLEEGQFSFTIAGAVSGLSLPKNTTVTNDADGKIDFGEIVFTLSDLDLDEEGNYVSPTTVTYLVTEDIPEAATAYNVLEETNIRYDDTVQEIQVTLTWDAESGTLTAEAAQEPEDITFTNELWPYVGQLDLAARKLLDGETPQGAYQNGFTFTLSAEDGAPLMDEDAAPIDEADLTVTNDGEDVTFPTLHFFKEDIGKTYSYLITEAQDHPDRIVYDERPCPITVTVTADEETRVITAEAVYREEDAEALFENETLEKTGQVVLSAVKKLVDKALTEGQFTFELLDQDGNVLQTKTNAADGKIVFDALTYTDADLALEGETKLTYTIREKNDHQENYTYDTKARTITVTLTDGGAGVINAVADKTGSEVTFTNYYEKPTPTYDYKFSFTKLWQGGHEESIDWVFYHSDGTVLHKKFNKKVVSDYEWQYEAWFEADGDYYIIENVPAGYKVRYENVGKHAGETDRCYNGGTIINYKVPNTGDSANPLLWIGCMLLGIGIACGVIVYGKKRKT